MSMNKCIKGVNDFKTWCLKHGRQDMLKEWDYTKNGDRTPENSSKASNKIFYFICSKGHHFEATLSHRTRHDGKNNCPYCSGHRVLIGYNDLATTDPKVALEWDYSKNGNLKPQNFTRGSGVSVWWKCSKGHSYQATITNKIVHNSGCPYCANLKVLKGYNDLATTNPSLAKEWDYEKNLKKPTEIVAGTPKKYWWRCSKGHSYLQAANARLAGLGCPYCSNHKLLKGFNDLATTHPHLVEEWDFSKNKIKPDEIVHGYEIKVWWKCKKCGHEWRAAPKDRSRTNQKPLGCPLCSNQKVIKGINDFGSNYPEILTEWDFSKNSISPYNYAPGSNKLAWWKCKKCGHEWKTSIASRVSGCGCQKCGYKKGTIERLKTYTARNGFKDKYPNLAKEWDYEKNVNLDINLIPASSNKNVWWRCPKGHSYQARVNTRTGPNKANCPYCSHQRVIKGETDLQTVNPYLAQQWHPTKNGDLTPSDVLSHSTKKVWWKCPACGHSWLAKVNNRINGRGCPNCSVKGTSFPEQAIYYYVKKIYPDAINRDKEFGKEIDIYLPTLKLGIEYDGFYYHKDDKALLLDNKKEEFLIKKGISLIRVRDYRLPKTKYAINIPAKDDYYPHIAETVERLLKVLRPNDTFNIDLRRDYVSILWFLKIKAKKNSIVVTNPELLSEWDYEKNGDLKPEYFTRGSDMKIWWKCKKCGYEWLSPISSRGSSGCGCPMCSRKKRANTRAKNIGLLSNIYPFVKKWWDFSKNKISINEVSHRSMKSVWFKCPNCGNSFKSKINNFVKRKKRCPSCKQNT